MRASLATASSVSNNGRSRLPAGQALAHVQHVRQADDEAASLQDGPALPIEQGAATAGDDLAADGGHLGDQLGLPLSEPRLALFCEYLRDGAAATGLDLCVQVDKRATQVFGQQAPHGRLAATHEAGERDISRGRHAPPDGRSRRWNRLPCPGEHATGRPRRQDLQNDVPTSRPARTGCATTLPTDVRRELFDGRIGTEA